jgi:hypothetical protein
VREVQFKKLEKQQQKVFLQRNIHGLKDLMEGGDTPYSYVGNLCEEKR